MEQKKQHGEHNPGYPVNFTDTVDPYVSASPDLHVLIGRAPSYAVPEFAAEALFFADSCTLVVQGDAGVPVGPSSHCGVHGRAGMPVHVTRRLISLQYRDALIKLFFAKFSNLNFHPLEVVSRYRDPQLQVGENYSHLFNLRPNIRKS